MRYLWFSLTTLLVVAAVGAPLFLLAKPAAVVAEQRPDGPRKLEAEQHYYVLLTVIEVEPKDAEESSWDAGSPPDLAYEIKWQGETVFESSTKDDTLVAKWSNISLELKDVVASVSLDDSIKAARITARPGDLIEFTVYDRDSTSGDDLIGSFAVPIERFHVGDQRWEAPAGRIRSAQCRVLPLDGVKFDTLTR